MAAGTNTKYFLSALFGGLIVALLIWFKPTFISNASFGSDESLQRENVEDIINKHFSIREQFQDMFDSSFKTKNDPFKKMLEIQEQMESAIQSILEPDEIYENPFDLWFEKEFGGGRVSDFKKKEDESHIYYEVDVEDLDKDTVETIVDEGYVPIEGEMNKVEVSGEGTKELTVVHFWRRLPLPENVDPNLMETKIENNLIIISLPKVKE